MSDEEAEKPDERSRIRPWHVLLVFSIILIVHAGSAAAIIYFFGDWSERGQFGDLFGAVNALFSGLAFAGVIVTILLQREELRLQRLELSQTREELRRSAAAQEASQLALHAQASASQMSARLASVNSLIEYYRSKLSPLESRVLAPGDVRYVERQLLRTKIQELSEKLDEIFNEVMKK
ncbi:MAG: hypothetical protein LCH62_13440 [Proteobacteria bacterium]|nr:hypothetical protein [Pseudomonadota bacterium]